MNMQRAGNNTQQNKVVTLHVILVAVSQGLVTLPCVLAHYAPLGEVP